MTREEAIEIIANTMFIGSSADDIDTAINMAIEALEREPSISEDGTLTVNVEDGNKVSRVLVCGDNHFGGLYYPEQENVTEFADKCRECGERYGKLLKEKVGRWIPVSERLPEEDGQYLITVKYVHVDGYDDIYAENGEWMDGKWDTFCFGHCGQVEAILAWMPLPEPYKAESEDKK